MTCIALVRLILLESAQAGFNYTDCPRRVSLHPSMDPQVLQGFFVGQHRRRPDHDHIYASCSNK